MELEGNKGLFGMGESSRTWSGSHRFPSFGRFEWALVLVWAQNGCFLPENVQIWEGTFRLGACTLGLYW